jgi:hypothetical protein
MGVRLNPLSGNFDFTGGSGGGGGSAFFAGEVATYADLPLDGTAALDSRWLVRSNSGTWPFSSYKQAGVYVRKAIVGASRDNDYQLTDTSFHDVMSDAAFVIYDDGAPTRSMQVEITDNETLTFKVTGTDSIVRSVAFALSAIVLAALMASSAIAQNIGLVSDTNGNIVTRRTNVLSFTNNLRFAPLTNADSRTALIGTNGALTAGNPPSGAAASGSPLHADGAGGSAFVANRTQTVAMTNSAFRTNTTDTSTVNAQTNMVLNLDASSTYNFAFAFIITSATTGGFSARLLHSNTTNGLRSTYVGRMGRPINVAASDITASSGGTISLQAVNFAGTNIVVTGTGILSTGTSSGTLTFIWYQSTATNVATELGAGSMITVTKINP